MSIQEQLIEDIKQLPDDILQDISVIVRKFVILNNGAVLSATPLKNNASNHSDFAERFPLFGCAKGKVWMADDFDAPMEEMEDYM